MYKINLLIGFLLLIPTNSAVTKAETAKTVGSKVDNWTLAVMGLLALGSKTVSCSDSDKPDFDESNFDELKKIVYLEDLTGLASPEQLKFNKKYFDMHVLCPAYTISMDQVKNEVRGSPLDKAEEVFKDYPQQIAIICKPLKQNYKITVEDAFRGKIINLKQIDSIFTFMAVNLRRTDQILTNSPTPSIETYQLYLKTFFLKRIWSNSFTTNILDSKYYYEEKLRYIEPFNQYPGFKEEWAKLQQLKFTLLSQFKLFSSTLLFGGGHTDSDRVIQAMQGYDQIHNFPITKEKLPLSEKDMAVINYFLAVLANYYILKESQKVKESQKESQTKGGFFYYLRNLMKTQLMKTQNRLKEIEVSKVNCLWLIKQCLKTKNVKVQEKVKLEIEFMPIKKIDSKLKAVESIQAPYLVPYLKALEISHLCTFGPFTYFKKKGSQVNKINLIRLSRKLIRF